MKKKPKEPFYRNTDGTPLADHIAIDVCGSDDQVLVGIDCFDCENKPMVHAHGTIEWAERVWRKLGEAITTARQQANGGSKPS